VCAATTLGGPGMAQQVQGVRARRRTPPAAAPQVAPAAAAAHSRVALGAVRLVNEPQDVALFPRA
jgi:hypothetical protein